MDVGIFVDRLASRLGYTRMPSPVTFEAVEDVSIPEVAPHLIGEASFDYGKVRDPRDWAFSYKSEGSLHFAIGRRGWMPLMLAGFVAGGHSADGMILFGASIFDRLWLRSDTPKYASWRAANERVVRYVEAIDVVCGDENDDAADFAPEMFGILPARVVSMELRTMWRRYQPYRPETVLSTTHEHILLLRMPWMREASQAPEKAMHQLMDWT